MRALIILAALLLSPWALAEVPDYVGRSLNKTVVVNGARRYTVPGGNGTRYLFTQSGSFARQSSNYQARCQGKKNRLKHYNYCRLEIRTKESGT